MIWELRGIRLNILGTRKIATSHPLKIRDYRVRHVDGR